MSKFGWQLHSARILEAKLSSLQLPSAFWLFKISLIVRPEWAGATEEKCAAESEGAGAGGSGATAYKLVTGATYDGKLLR